MSAEPKYGWNKTRQKGKLRFILIGTFFWGLGVAFSSILTDYIFEFSFDDAPNYLHRSDNFVLKILARSVMFLFVGFFSSYLLWNYNEEKYPQNSEEK